MWIVDFKYRLAFRQRIECWNSIKYFLSIDKENASLEDHERLKNKTQGGDI